MNIPKVVELTFSKNKSEHKVNRLPHTLDKKILKNFLIAEIKFLIIFLI